MVEDDPHLVDRLQERGLIDRYGFMTFAIVGSLAIVAAKFWVLPAWAVAVGAVLFLFAYAIIINLRGTGKLRSDQAGDNCYYLGLIYTLSSLSYAIFTFDPADTATTIVRGFGIALATTIAGLVLRVFFNQSRVDLYEIEETVRMELTEAAATLKTELGQIALDFKHFSIGLQQAVTEVKDEATKSIEESGASSIDAIKGLANEVLQSLHQEIASLSSSASQLAQEMDNVRSGLGEHAKSLTKITKAHEKVVSDVGNMAEATVAMKSNSDQALNQMDALRVAQSAIDTIMGRTSESASSTLQATQAVLETVRRFETEFAKRLDELEAGPKQAADKALEAIARAAQSVEASMNRLTEVQDAAIVKVSNSTEGLLSAVQGHNAELESELRRSREYVQQVHGALVEMTERLNNTIG